jgi:hypothetical protein
MAIFRHNLPRRAAPPPRTTRQHPVSSNIFYWTDGRSSGTRLADIPAKPFSSEIAMKLQFGRNQLVLEFSTSPFAWFHGQTERMSLTSLSLMFVQFSLFARQSAA